MFNSFKTKGYSQKACLESTKYADLDPLLAFQFARSAYLFCSDDLDTIENFATVLFNLRDFDTVIDLCDKWLQNGQYNDDEKKAKVHAMRGKSYYYTFQYSKVVDDIQTAIKLYLARHNDEKAKALKEFLDNTYIEQDGPKTLSDDEKLQLVAFVRKHLDQPQLPDHVGGKVYILPVSWLNRWKKYIEYSKVLGEGDGMMLEEDKPSYVGPIMPHSILSDEASTVDPSPESSHENMQLKLGLTENVDFMIIDEELWDFLFKNYGGIPVQRYTYRKTPEDFNVSVEVWLQKVNVWVVPVALKEQPSVLNQNDVTYISKRKTVGQLKLKISRSLAVFFSTIKDKESILSKLDSRFDIKKTWKDWDGKIDFVIASKKFTNENISIEEAEIADTDFMVFEAKIVGSWFIKYADDVDKLKRSMGRDSGVMVTSDMKTFPSGAKKGLTGLQNLGNTCFMNSAIQCLSNTYELTSYFLTNEFEKDINSANPLGAGGKLAIAYSGLMKEIWFGTNSSTSPWELKKIIGKQASQFIGYGQQDSQELLSYLLDGLHEDLNKIKKKPIIESKDYDDSVKDEIIAAESWENHLKRNKSKIQETMHGQFKSTLICPTCKRVSITCDPFMMLSVPIPTSEYAKFFIYFIFSENRKKVPVKATFNLPTTATYEDIKERIGQVTKTNSNDIVMAFLKDHKIVEFADRSSTPTYLKDHAGIVFTYEVPNIERNIEVEESKSILLKVLVQAEPKAFYESEKAVSFTRLVKIESTMTLKQVFIQIYRKFRHHINIYFQKQKINSIIDLDDWTDETLDKEYSILFNEENESKFLYRLHYRDDAPKSGGKSKKCSDLDERDQFSSFLQRVGIQEKNIVFEVKITKNTKVEDLSLNQCTDLANVEGDEEGGKKEYDVYDCLNHFTKKETLEKGNEWYCNKCKEHKLASKKMEIYRAPPVLIIHLKRFKTSKVGNIGSFYYSQGSKKITAQVNFPQENLDLSRYVLGPDRDQAIYDLYAVSNHYGGLGGGHYTAYCKNQFDQRWYDFNDSSVSSASSKEIVSPSAYVLFYRRKQPGKL